MNCTRRNAEHAATAAGGRELWARVRLCAGNSTPPVQVDCQDAGSNYVGGYLSLEAAELLRRALNDVLGPVQEAREEKDRQEKALDVARNTGRWSKGG